MGLSEVNFWYDSFENGNFDMTQNYPNVLSVSETVSLEEIPEKRQKLDHHHETAPPKVFQEIKVIYIEDQMFVAGRGETEGDRFHFRFKKTGSNNYQFFDKNEEPKSCSGSFLDAGLSQFKLLIEGNVQVKELTFRYRTGYEEVELKPFIEGIARIMGELNGFVQVEKLSIPSITGMDIDSVFQKILPGSLKILNIKLIGYVKMFEMSKMRSFKAHLAYLDEFSSNNRKIDMPIDSFSHMKEVRVQLISITEEQALRYKQIVLQLGTVSRHIIESDKQSMAVLKAAFNSCTHFLFEKNRNGKTEVEEIGTIPFSDPTKGCLELTFFESALQLEGKKPIRFFEPFFSF
ncbi:unnamed protein product [Caenorhabditis brenneri]